LSEFTEFQFLPEDKLLEISPTLSGLNIIELLELWCCHETSFTAA